MEAGEALTVGRRQVRPSGSGAGDRTEADKTQERKGGRPDALDAWWKAIDLLLLSAQTSFEFECASSDPGYRKEKIVRADPRYL